MYSYAGVSIPFHILIPNGICQALLPFAAGYARDRGARPAYILAFSSFLVASAPFVLTMTSVRLGSGSHPSQKVSNYRADRGRTKSCWR